MSIRIGMTGDVMLGRLVDDRQSRRPVAAVWGDLLERLRELDGLIINLECCLSTGGEPWRRTNRPFHFRADPDWAVPALQAAGVDCCALANNHVLDFEVEALRDTLNHLEDAGIAYAGAGRNRREAFEPVTATADGCDVAVVSLTDNTPEYAATDDAPGTAHVEIDVDDHETRTSVRNALGRAEDLDPDLVLASLHWGPNMVDEPPESFREFGRWLLNEGFDVVHGHSAHIFQGIERYDGRPILYDCGDFVDDYAVDDQLRNDRSFLFELSVTATGDLESLRLIPTEIDDCQVREASSDAAEWSRERIRELSGEFGTTFDRDGDHLVLELEG